MSPTGILNFLGFARIKKSRKMKLSQTDSKKVQLRKLRLESLEERALLTVCTTNTQEALISAIQTATQEGGDQIVTFASDMDIEVTNSDDSTFEYAAFVLAKDVVLDGGTHNINLIAKNSNVKMFYVGLDVDRNQGANVTIKNVSLQGKGGTATDATYAMKIFSGSATLENVNISNFYSSGTSGTICLTGSQNETSLQMLNCTIHDNTADGGGAINVEGTHSSMTITGGSIYNCQATFGWGGGGLNVTGGADVKITGTKFYGLQSLEGGYGGAIYVYASDLELNSCVFYNNSANGDGGAIYTEGDTTLKIWNTAIYANVSDNMGGAIYMKKGVSFTMTNCTIVGNAALDVGGIYIGSLTDQITCYNSIVYNNDMGNLGGTITLTNFSNSSVNATELNASFASYNGNRTDYATWNLTPIAAPFIDSGENSYALNMTEITKDVNGYSRFSSTQGVGSTAATVDIGAYEYQQYLPATTVLNAACTSADFSNPAEPKANVSLEWTDIPDAAFYTIRYKKTTMENWTEVVVEKVAARSMSMPIEAFGAFYDFQIQAVDNTNTIHSDWSSPIRVEVPGDEITVTTTSDVVNANDGEFSLRECLQTYGAYNPNGTIQLATNATYVLSVDSGEIIVSTSKIIVGNGSTISGNNTSRIFSVTNNTEDINVVINDVTLQKGNAVNGSGGAVLLKGITGTATLTIGTEDQVTFSTNHADRIGGALFATGDSVLRVEAAVFQSNTALNGGAVGNFLSNGESAANFTIAGETAGAVVFNDNIASRLGGAYFGCGCADIQNAVFGSSSKGNKALTAGAIYNETRDNIDASVTLTHCSFNYNTTTGNDNNNGLGNGGAIGNWGVMTITQCEFGTSDYLQSGNTALFNGGAIFNGKNGNIELTNTSFHYNKVGTSSINGYGGAINNIGSLTINASTLALGQQNLSLYQYNEATCNGGAIANTGTLTLDTTYDNISFTNNTAKLYGGGIVSIGTLGFVGTSYKVTTSSNIITSTTHQEKGRNIANGNGSITINDTDIDWTGDVNAGVHNYTYNVVTQFLSYVPVEDIGQADSSRVLADENNDGIFEEISVFSTTGLNLGINNVPVKLVDSFGYITDAVVVLEVVGVDPTIVVTATEFANSQLLKLDIDVCPTAVSQNWKIHWGDGTTSELSVYANSITATHFYTPGMSYDISLELISSNGVESNTSYFVKSHFVPSVDEHTQITSEILPEETDSVLIDESVKLTGNIDFSVPPSLSSAFANDVLVASNFFEESQPDMLSANLVDEVIPFFSAFEEDENDLDFVVPQNIDHENDYDFVTSEISVIMNKNRLEVNLF